MVLNSILRASDAYGGPYRAMVEQLVVEPGDLAVVRLHEQGGVRGFYRLVLEAGRAELDLMFVANGFTRRGIGRLLFDDMAQQARANGCASVRIVSHPPAAGFYERMGAKRIGIQPPGGRATWERPVFERVLA